MNPKNKPEFLKQGVKYLKRVRPRWRRPRGRHSKLRVKEKSKGKMPNVGYRAPKSLRGLHPCGLKEVVVHNLKELSKINPKEEAVKIASTVGKKLRAKIIEKAKQLGLKILNP